MKTRTFRAVVRWGAGATALAGTLACAPSGAVPSGHAVLSEPSMLEKGVRLASSGQSLRAEQYLTAAVEQGASWDEVILPLVEVCIQGGRLESALRYVQQHTQRHPLEPVLHHLSATLALSLRKWDLARKHVDLLSDFERIPAETLLFLGDYYQRYASLPHLARRYYAAYLLAAPQGERALAVRALLERGPEKGAR